MHCELCEGILEMVNKMNMTINENELIHHGILGMKWGVRRYQNKDGSRTDAGKLRYSHDKIVIRKGEEVQRISKISSESPTGRTYISFKELDNLKYTVEAGGDGLYWTSNYDNEHPNDPLRSNYGFKIKLKVTDDIIAPSFDESIDAFVKTVGNTPINDLVNDLYGKKDDQPTRYAKKEYIKKNQRFYQ